jgi:cation diffusion facilitator family transporter
MEKGSDRIKELKQGRKVAFMATFITLVLAVIKAVVGHLFGSEVLIADAFHSGADLLAIFASGFGLWLASKQKTAKFPYGLFKAETLVSFFIGAGIIWAGVELVRDGYHKLFYVSEAQGFPILPVIASSISIVVAYFLARKEKKVGRAINSQSLMINASESFLDIFVSIVVLIGIILSYLRIPYVEGAIIIIISILIFRLGFKNVWISLLVLMDANLEPQLQTEIEDKINKIYGVKGVGDINIRQSGPFKMIECKIATSPTLPLFKAHELADTVEDYIKRNYKHIESVFIHIEPAKERIMTAIIPVKDINDINSRVHGQFGRAPYFIILKMGEEDEIEIEDFYSNPFLGAKKHVGIKVIKAVIEYKLDVLFTNRIGEISFHTLKDNFVDIYQIEVDTTVKEVIERYRRGELKKIIAPTHQLEESEVEK